MKKNEWQEAQKFEASWWNFSNTYGEETKQLLYAEKMGLKTFHDGKSPFNFDIQKKSVLDIGGGPVSLLLKCKNVKGTVVDPMKMPNWVLKRYGNADIEFIRIEGENIDLLLGSNENFDEVWIYNCLQHTENPERIIREAKKVGKLIRIFEWIDIPVCEGHPHELTETKLNKWLGGEGKVEELKGQNTCFGKCYYGIFV